MANMGKKIIFTVFNDTRYDQRMIRICTSLSEAGYDVTLVGRKPKIAIPLPQQLYKQHRLVVPFSKGKLLYISFNVRLLAFLLFKKMDAICAIDLDTILPCYLTSILRNKTRIYDPHELFCEMKEIVTRPLIYRVWKRIEKFAVPRFKHGYTVNSLIAAAFCRSYAVSYAVIRSIAVMDPLPDVVKKDTFIIYQGAVNEGRSFETLIPAMQWVNATLLICGDGNFMQQAKKMVQDYNLQKKVVFKGLVPPEQLKNITAMAAAGITLFESDAVSNYYSLANRFFDYMHAGIPQICVDYPAYREINNLYNIAVLISDLSAENIAAQINTLLNNYDLHVQLSVNCLRARTFLNWQQEEKKLVSFYNNILL